MIAPVGHTLSQSPLNQHIGAMVCPHRRILVLSRNRKGVLPRGFGQSNHRRLLANHGVPDPYVNGGVRVQRRAGGAAVFDRPGDTFDWVPGAASMTVWSYGLTLCA